MKLSMDDLNKMDVWIDEKLYGLGVEVGNLFSAAYGGEDKGMSQVRNMQNIAFQATRFSAIENFVKNQIGKEKDGCGWLHRGAERGAATLGDRLLEDFGKIAKKAEALAMDQASNKVDYAKMMEIELRLVRAYVDALAAQFAYKKKGA